MQPLSESPASAQGLWNLLTAISEAAKFASLSEAERYQCLVERVIRSETQISQLARKVESLENAPINSEISKLVMAVIMLKLGELKPSEYWLERIDRNESPAEFMHRVYKVYITAWVIDLKDLAIIDYSLYRAINQYCSKNGMSMKTLLPTFQDFNEHPTRTKNRELANTRSRLARAALKKRN